MRLRTTLVGLVLVCASISACQSSSPPPPAATATAPAGIDPNDPLTIVPDLAKAHKDKIDFAWYVTAPLLHSGIDGGVKTFAKSMEADHKRLLARITEWAKKHDVSIKYVYAPGLQGTALKNMEKMQGDLIQADSSPNFQHDYLILTWTDLDWQRNLLKAAIPHATDPDLKAYLQDALDTQNKERETCRALLAKYKW